MSDRMILQWAALLGAFVAEPASVGTGASPADEGWAFSLRWNAPAACPQGPEILDDVARLLGEPVTPSPAGETRIVGQVREVQPNEWLLSLDIDSADGKGQRVLSGASCRELAEAAVVVIAVTIAPASAFPVEAAPVAEPESPSSTPRSTSLVRTVKTSPAPAWRWSVWAGPALTMGTMPRLDPGVTGGVRWGRQSWRVEATAAYFAPQRQTLAIDSSLGGVIAFAWGGARACWQPHRKRLAVPACLGAQAGSMWAEAFGVDESTPDNGLWLAGEASLGLTVAINDHVAASIRSALAIPIVRPGFKINKDEQIHVPAPVAAFAWASVELGVP